MSNTGSCFKKASPLTLHPHPLLSPPQMARTGTVEEIKMIVCWQEQGQSSFQPCRQQKWHHISPKWHINKFSITWTFLEKGTFYTSKLSGVSNNKILYPTLLHIWWQNYLLGPNKLTGVHFASSFNDIFFAGELQM